MIVRKTVSLSPPEARSDFFKEKKLNVLLPDWLF